MSVSLAPVVHISVARRKSVKSINEFAYMLLNLTELLDILWPMASVHVSVLSKVPGSLPARSTCIGESRSLSPSFNIQDSGY